MNLNVRCCIKISKRKFVAMATIEQTEPLENSFLQLCITKNDFFAVKINICLY